MKILILQLARLGDIYQTWPVARALRRGHPGAEIHILVRDKFKDACQGLEAVDRVWALETKRVLEPLIDLNPDLDLSLSRLRELCASLGGEAFERIINLSFSPFSSHLCHHLSAARPGACEVTGYTRQADGYLAIPDDASAYFYAQAGPGRASRVHVTDLFAQVAGAYLEADDWRAPGFVENKPPRDRIAVHVGASQAEKAYSPQKWARVVKGLLTAGAGEVVLIGAAAEAASAQLICDACHGRQPTNLVGKTTIRELCETIAESKLLIGADSGPVHIAALTSTPVLNLSFKAVSFWETGPKSARSRILAAASEADLPSDQVVDEALRLLDGRPSARHAISVAGPLMPYLEPAPGRSVEWEMAAALYMGGPFPYATERALAEGIVRLYDANRLALQQIAALRADSRNQVAAKILNQVDQIFTTIEALVPAVGVIVRWFQTERLRLGPMELGKLVDATESLHLKLDAVLKLYVPEDFESTKETTHGNKRAQLG